MNAIPEPNAQVTPTNTYSFTDESLAAYVAARVAALAVAPTMRLNDEELELVSIARGQSIDEMVAVVEHIVAARVAEALAPIEALADQWAELGDTDSAFWWSTLATHVRAALPDPEPTP